MQGSNPSRGHFQMFVQMQMLGPAIRESEGTISVVEDRVVLMHRGMVTGADQRQVLQGIVCAP